MFSTNRDQQSVLPTPVCLRCYLSRESLLFDINDSNKDCVVRPDNFKHDVINFRDMRLVDILTQNPVLFTLTLALAYI